MGQVDVLAEPINEVLIKSRKLHHGGTKKCLILTVAKHRQLVPVRPCADHSKAMVL